MLEGEVTIDRRCVVGRYDQHFEDHLDLSKTAIQYLRQRFPSVSEQEARRSLGMFGLGGEHHLVRMSALSGGQKARVIFASLRLLQPHILLLDEPTNHLDIESVDALIFGLQNYAGGVVFVSHDERLISTATELWVCDGHASGLRVEKGGFPAYRKHRLAVIATKVQKEVALAQQRERERAKAATKRQARMQSAA